MLVNIGKSGNLPSMQKDCVILKISNMSNSSDINNNNSNLLSKIQRLMLYNEVTLFTLRIKLFTINNAELP